MKASALRFVLCQVKCKYDKVSGVGWEGARLDLVVCLDVICEQLCRGHLSLIMICDWFVG
jgi:hypothetical protein